MFNYHKTNEYSVLSKLTDMYHTIFGENPSATLSVCWLGVEISESEVRYYAEKMGITGSKYYRSLINGSVWLERKEGPLKDMHGTIFYNSEKDETILRIYGTKTVYSDGELYRSRRKRTFVAKGRHW